MYLVLDVVRLADWGSQERCLSPAGARYQTSMTGRKNGGVVMTAFVDKGSFLTGRAVLSTQGAANLAGSPDDPARILAAGHR